MLRAWAVAERLCTALSLDACCAQRGRSADGATAVASVFISYARADGRTLADRLAADLERNHHHPWIDRAELQGGEVWSREIEAAIDDCDLLVAVLTHGAYESRICRNEHERALRKGKLIVPILAQADADRSLQVESVNYIDFSDPAAFGDRFTQLLGAIDRREGIRVEDLPTQRRERLMADRHVHAMAAPLRDRSADWSQILELALEQRDRFLGMLAPRRGGIGIFENALYVARAAPERELARFVDGDVPGLVLIGDAGVGKTNLLCSWGLQAAADGHAVFLYHGDRLRSSEVLRELLPDMGLEGPGAVPDALDRIDELAHRQGRRVIIAFDGINRFRGRQSEQPGDLIAEIDFLAARLAGTSFRIVLSCSTPTWNRLERLGASLTWTRYHRTEADEEFVALRDFDDEEAAAAYDAYRRHFDLIPAWSDLPAAVRLRLRHPLLLRFFAETSRGTPLTSDEPILDNLIQRYLAERLRLHADRLFVDQLVGEMHQRRRAALPVSSLVQHDILGPAVRDEGPDNSYSRLLDAGVLVQVDGDGLFVDDVVRFTYPLVGAYTLAGRLLRAEVPLEQAVYGLVDDADDLPFAWEAAAIMLATRGDDRIHATLASSARPDLRELAIESLVRLQAADDARARTILLALLDGDSMEAQRTALRAAYNIGPAMRDLFLHAAMSRSDALRQAVRDTLYLIWSGQARAREPMSSTGYFLWRHAPGFTWDLMRDLVAQVSWIRPQSTRRIMRFVLDLVITIYVNHCERQEVAQQTADLYYELTVNRLHLDRIRLGGRIERVVLRVVAAVFSNLILSWILTGEADDADAFFARPREERMILRDLAPLLDPDSDFRAADALLRQALSSDVDVFRGCAALVAAIHAHAHFEANEAVLRGLFDGLDGRGRLWLLIGLSVLLPTTPPGWTQLTEEFTRRLLDEHPDLVYRQTPAGVVDIVFVPLGLAYGKRDAGMPLLEERLASALAGNDVTRVTRLIAGLGPVGFYYPRVVLATLRPHRERLTASPAYEQALVSTLGIIRTLHVDRVDAFLTLGGSDDTLQRRVAATADVQLVNRFVPLLGYYNNAVHYCLNYPRMRGDLGVFALELLARAGSANEFVVDYAEQAIRMARDAGFRLLEWTLPIEA